MSGALTAFLEESRRVVDADLDRVVPAADVAPARLHAAMRHALFGGGKRLRPACVRLAAAAVGGDPAAALPAASAVELIHTYSLVHDDLPCMDDDDLRRGRPTVHRAFDEATAVLAGDALLTLAFEVVAARLPAPLAAGAAVRLARGAGSLGMVGGQADDLAAEGRSLEAEAILSIDERKTAALFAASFEVGGLCGGAAGETLERLGAIGRNLGVAFQVVDDLLDLRSSPEQLGKATGKDRERGKATLPAAVGEPTAFARAERFSAAAADLSRTLRAGELIQELARIMLQRSH